MQQTKGTEHAGHKGGVAEGRLILPRGGLVAGAPAGSPAMTDMSKEQEDQKAKEQATTTTKGRRLWHEQMKTEATKETTKSDKRCSHTR